MRTLLGLTLAAILASFLGAPVGAQEQRQTRRVAVVFVQFRDSALSGVDDLREQTRSLFFDAPGSLDEYYRRVSGGAAGFTSAGHFGPVTLDADASCDTKAMAEAAEEAVDKPFDDLAVVFPNADAGCKWAGLANVPGTRMWFVAEDLSQAAVLHEKGHNFGLNHQVRDVCPDGAFTGCRESDYSRRTPMGAGGDKVGLSAPELTAARWPASGRVTPTESTTVQLVPLHSSRSGMKVIDVPFGADRIVVEYRAPDARTVDSGVTGGVNVYRVPGGKYGSSRIIDGTPDTTTQGDNSLPVGGVLADRASGLSITVLAASTDSASVRVAWGPETTPSAPPTTPPPTTSPSSTSSTAPPTSSPATSPAPDTVESAPPPPAPAPVAFDTGWDVHPNRVVLIALTLVAGGALLVLFARRARSRR